MNTQNYSYPIFDKEIKDKNKWTGEKTASFPSGMI